MLYLGTYAKGIYPGIYLWGHFITFYQQVITHFLVNTRYMPGKIVTVYLP